MIPKALLLFLLLLLPAISAHAAPPARLAADDAKAYHVIATVEHFCSERVGYAGKIPEVVIAFRTLLKSPQADAAFKRLLDDATTTPAGKLFALCGLYYTDPAFFDRAVQPFRRSSEQVKTMMGCSISPSTVGAIVERSGPWVVRLKSREQTVQQWELETKPKTMYYDIIGGGWPNTFEESGGFPRR